MKRHSLTIIIFVLWGVLLQPYKAEEADKATPHTHPSESQMPQGEPPDIYNQMLKNPVYREKAMAMEEKLGCPPKTIYGRVIDQNGKPVAKAVVDIMYHENPIVFKYLQVMTDKNGNWQCRIPKSLAMGTPAIAAIRRHGIEWIREQEPDFRECMDWEKWEAMWRATSPRNRHLNTVTSKGESSYLVEYSYPKIKMGLHAERPDGYVNMIHASFAYTLDQPLLISDATEGKVSENEPLYDLHFHVRRLENISGWEIVIQPYGKNAGILLRDGEPASEAPLEGYRKKLDMTIRDGETFDWLLYTKTRRFPLYSEIHVTVKASDPAQKEQQETGGEAQDKCPERWVNVFVRRFVFNPFGKRCMNWDDGYNEADLDRIAEIIEGKIKNDRLPDEKAIMKMRVIPDYTKEPLK